MNGKIIAITGGPRTGKSTLARLLSEKMKCESFLEGEEKDFPERILEDISLGKRTLELILWFRNKCVLDYLKALETKKRGGIVMLDTFWATNDVYLDEWVFDGFEKDILKDLVKIDYELLPWPDLVLSLRADKNKIQKLVAVGGRRFELSNDFLQKQINLNNAHENYFRKLNKSNIYFIDVSKSDYLIQEELDSMISFIKKHW